MVTNKLLFEDFNKVKSELKHNHQYLVSFPDDTGSPQIMLMQYNQVGKQLYASINNQYISNSIVLYGDMLDECRLCKLDY